LVLGGLDIYNTPIIYFLFSYARRRKFLYLPYHEIFDQPTNQPKDKSEKARRIQVGKNEHLNPILYSSKKKQQPNERKIRRKIRKDKLHDIKIPINENIDLTLRRESRKFWNGSKTALGTEIFLYGLNHLFQYPDVDYKDSPMTVHIKVDHATFQRIGEYSTKWRCSIRKATHRIFMEAYLKKYGGISNEEV